MAGSLVTAYPRNQLRQRRGRELRQRERALEHTRFGHLCVGVLKRTKLGLPGHRACKTGPLLRSRTGFKLLCALIGLTHDAPCVSRYLLKLLCLRCRT